MKNELLDVKQHLWCSEYDYKCNCYSPVMTTVAVKQLHITSLKGFYFYELDILGYKRAGVYSMQAKISCLWVNLPTFSKRHVNDNCDLTIQAVATCWFVDVAHKLRKCYSSISQIC